MAELFITFGRKYVTEDHPVLGAIDPDGYLRVVYCDEERGDVRDRRDECDVAHDAMSSRERARQTVWRFLDGQYAFDYDEQPEERYAPAGEILTMVLP